MLTVRIRNLAGDVIAEGTCSDSGFFPPAVATNYNAALDRGPARSLRSWDNSSESSHYPEATRRARVGYTLPRHLGGGQILDEDVIFHVERS